MQIKIKTKNKMKNQCKEIARLLFELEHDSILNNLDFYLDFLGWEAMYGKRTTDYLKNLRIESHYVERLADMILSDYQSGLWSTDVDGSIYNPLMRDEYIGYIDNCITNQLSISSGIGYQLTIV